jgi:hypothetical protein
MRVQYPSGTVRYRYHDHAIGSAISRVGSVSIHRSESPRAVSVRDVLKIQFLKNLSSLFLRGSHRIEAESAFHRYRRGSNLNRRCENCSGSRQQN